MESAFKRCIRPPAPEIGGASHSLKNLATFTNLGEASCFNASLAGNGPMAQGIASLTAQWGLPKGADAVKLGLFVQPRLNGDRGNGRSDPGKVRLRPKVFPVQVFPDIAITAQQRRTEDTL